ncbi:hypothetical protein LWE61_12415 [Sphingobium sufflavum]|uniref:hypothetical protein n=1 Tax=Sphingobium sufflavum TaxID=1129547 RepID=UPI001F1E3871|nr:hypothetical protein [Sphingobium sufflavum]MCE7797359.1 hypothetical protein [Sphingobium sufflavum]
MTLTKLMMQNHMLAIRQEMGYPLTAPACHTIAWSAGGPVDIQIGMDLGRLAETAGRDMVYGAWASVAQELPTDYVLALRGPMVVDIIRNCTFYAADDTTPIVVLSEYQDEHFVLNERLYLERRRGMPGRRLALGRRRAMERIRVVAAGLDDVMLEGNAIVQRGGRWTPPAPTPVETVIRFA